MSRFELVADPIRAVHVPGLAGTPAAGTLAYQLKLQLEWVRPAVWRHIVVEAAIDLPSLHQTLTRCMGWSQSDVHEFIFSDQVYAQAGLAQIPSEGTQDEQGVQLHDALGPTDAFLYVHDWAAQWCLRVQVEKRISMPGAGYPA